MVKIVFAIPVASEQVELAGQTFAKWQRRGYGTAALVDGGGKIPANVDSVISVAEYKGWAWAVNLFSSVLPDADFIVTGGADVYPDGDHEPAIIAGECVEQFGGTFGVMQPAGDAYGAVADKAACVSPWIGKEFRERVYGGHGPMHEGYRHWYADAELMHVAERLGCFWWREDVSQYHDHFGRRGEPTPKHLLKWLPEHESGRQLYEQRRLDDWPGHEPTP